MGESPDLTRSKLPLGVVVGMIVTVVAALVGIGGQAVFIVYSVTQFKTKSETERMFDVEAQKDLKVQVGKLSDDLAAQSKTLVGVEAALTAQSLLLTDVRERMASLENGKK